MVTNFKKNKKGGGHHRVFLHLIGIFLLAVLVVLITANIHMYKKRQAYLAQVAQLEQQMDDLQKSNDQLKTKIENADDSGYIEKVAREELDLQKEGEQAVSFVVPEGAEEKPATQNPVQSWFFGVWNWIKNIF